MRRSAPSCATSGPPDREQMPSSPSTTSSMPGTSPPPTRARSWTPSSPVTRRTAAASPSRRTCWPSWHPSSRAPTWAGRRAPSSSTSSTRRASMRAPASPGSRRCWARSSHPTELAGAAGGHRRHGRPLRARPEGHRRLRRQGRTEARPGAPGIGWRPVALRLRARGRSPVQDRRGRRCPRRHPDLEAAARREPRPLAPARLRYVGRAGPHRSRVGHQLRQVPGPRPRTGAALPGRGHGRRRVPSARASRWPWGPLTASSVRSSRSSAPPPRRSGAWPVASSGWPSRRPRRWAWLSSSPKSWRSSARSARRTSRPRPRSMSRCASLLAEAPTRAEAEAKLAALKAIPESARRGRGRRVRVRRLRQGQHPGLRGRRPVRRQPGTGQRAADRGARGIPRAAARGHRGRPPRPRAPRSSPPSPRAWSRARVPSARRATPSAPRPHRVSGMASPQGAGKVAGRLGCGRLRAREGPEDHEPGRAPQGLRQGRRPRHADAASLHRRQRPPRRQLLGERAGQGQRSAGRVPGHDHQDDGRGQG